MQQHIQLEAAKRPKALGMAQARVPASQARPRAGRPAGALAGTLAEALDALFAKALSRAAWSALLSGLLLVQAGHRDAGSGLLPLNAISHWIWPRSALRATGLSLRHTLAGAMIHFYASCFWSMLFGAWRLLRPDATQQDSSWQTATQALVLSAVAACVDLALVPPALRPGFERHLSGSSLVMVYLGFAAGMAWGDRVPTRRTARQAGCPRPALARPPVTVSASRSPA